MKWFGAGLVFLSELGMYVCLVVAAVAALDAPWRLALAIAAPVLVATFWGMYLSPKARRPLPAPVTVTLRFALVLGSAAAGIAAGAVWLGVATAALILVGTPLGRDAVRHPGWEGRDR